MPTYVNNQLQKHLHPHPKNPQHVLLPAPTIKYGHKKHQTHHTTLIINFRIKTDNY